MNNFQGMEHHFERVASVYDHVRNTDPDVIDAIILRLPRFRRPIDLADVGCGTGRYSKILARRLNSRLRLFCFDYSRAMLTECRRQMTQEFPSTYAHYCLTRANDLALANCSFDAITTFNAVHHFNLDRFVAEAAHALRPGGLLSIYTRTPAQNARTVWGQHFPGFTKRETRLYQCERLKEAIDDLSELRLEAIQEFKHVRVERLESLLNRARNYHYSTFALYPTYEFRLALDTFSKRLTALSHNSKIKHTAENTLILARRI